MNQIERIKLFKFDLIVVTAAISLCIIMGGCDCDKEPARPELLKEGKITDLDYVGRYADKLQITFDDGSIRLIYPNKLDIPNAKEIKIGQTGKLLVTGMHRSDNQPCGCCDYIWETWDYGYIRYDDE